MSANEIPWIYWVHEERFTFCECVGCQDVRANLILPPKPVNTIKSWPNLDTLLENF